MPVGSSVRSDPGKALEHPGDLYRLPQEVVDLWAGVFRPGPLPSKGGPGPELLVVGPTAGDGRICFTLADRLGCQGMASDLLCAGVYGGRVVSQGDALEWRRPDFAGRVIVAENLPFSLQDPIVARLWAELLPFDELCLWMRDMALCCDSRPGDWHNKGVFPFHDHWAFHWRVRHERPDGSLLPCPSESHGFYRVIKGFPARITETHHFFRRV